ncbi:MFS transporter [Bradyrhizobium sp. STM 3562]|uniref:MFS transporter n=1 Tax=Bradyrhizobium sp. STM 3562 TaxID=578924 RepID=UPI003890DDE3
MLQNAEASPLESAIRRSAWRLLPFLMLMLIMAFLDRVNIGFVKLAYQADTGIGDAAYAFGAGVFFIGYALFEVPSNLVLRRVGARTWLARIMVSWGLISAAMIFARSETIFHVLRFLLGVAEAGFYPGVLLYLTYWFPAKQRARATGLFYLGVPLSLVFGSPLSGFLLQFDGVMGLKDWQFVLVVEGIAAVVVGIVAFFYLCNGPAEAPWLTLQERKALSDEIAREEALKAQQVEHSALGVLKDLRVIAFILVYFCFQVGTSPFSFYFPSKLASAMGGKVDFTIGLLLALPWLCSAIGTLLATSYADRHENHCQISIMLIIAGALASAAVGFTNNPVLLVIAFCIAVPGLTSSQPVFWSLPTQYLSGVGAASGIAFIVSLGNLGGFLSPQIKTYAEQALGSNSSGYLVLSIIAAAAAVILLCLPRREPRNRFVPPLAALDAAAGKDPA